mgnify:CR=1 FL=1
MKLIPRDFDLFSSPFEGFGSLMNIRHPLSTDIVEDGENLKIIMDLPGVKKENVKIILENGYLTVSASTKGDSEEKNEEGTFIRRERHSGELTRSFAVSKDVSKDEIKAKLEDGTLTLLIPKEPTKDASSNMIEIE